MSTETNTALENKAHVADVLPESARNGLSTPKADYGAGEFWNDEPKTDKKAEVKTEVEPKKEAAVETPDPITSLAGKWGAKVKAPAADVASLVKPGKVEKTETKAEVVPDGPDLDKLELGAHSSPRATENFKILKGIARQEREAKTALQREIAELRSKPSAVVPTAVDTTELDRIRAENKAMSDKLLLIDTKNHPAFQNQYVKPRIDAVQAANELLKANGKEFDVSTLIDRPRGEIGKALQEVLKDLPSLDQTEISDNVRKAWQLSQAEKTALSNAGQVNGQIKEADSKTHIHAFDSTWDKVSAGVAGLSGVEKIPDNVTPQQRQMIEAYNRDITSLRENARAKATGSTTYESIAQTAIQAAAFEVQQNHVMPMLAAQISDMQETIKGLKAEVEGYRSRNPNRDISPTTSETRSSSKAKSIDELGAEMLSGMGRRT